MKEVEQEYRVFLSDNYIALHVGGKPLESVSRHDVRAIVFKKRKTVTVNLHNERTQSQRKASTHDSEASPEENYFLCAYDLGFTFDVIFSSAGSKQIIDWARQ
jgi:hypothetical protein